MNVLALKGDACEGSTGRGESRGPGRHLPSAPYNERGEPAARVVSVSRSIGYALVSGSDVGWRGFRFILSARLTVPERGELAYAALTAMTPEDAGEVIARFASLLPETREVVAGAASGAGYPYVLPGEELASARLWAAEATDREREAFCLASFEAMSPERRTAFVSFAHRGAAA